MLMTNRKPRTEFDCLGNRGSNFVGANNSTDRTSVGGDETEGLKFGAAVIDWRICRARGEGGPGELERDRGKEGGISEIDQVCVAVG